MSTIASWAHASSARYEWALGQSLVVLGVIAAFVLVPLVSSSSLDAGLVVTGLGTLAAVAGVGLKRHVQHQRAGDVGTAEAAALINAPSGFVVIGLLVIAILSLYYCTR